MVNVDEGQAGGKLEESTSSISVSDVAGEDHLRENLVELFHILAFFQMGF